MEHYFYIYIYPVKYKRDSPAKTKNSVRLSSVECCLQFSLTYIMDKYTIEVNGNQTVELPTTLFKIFSFLF